MKILIVSATRKEVHPLLSEFHFRKISNHLLRGLYRKITIDILVTDPGMVSTAYRLTRLIDCDYRFIINVGMAGSFNKKYSFGDVVHVTRDYFAELGAESRKGFIPYRKLGMTGSDIVINNHRIQNKVLAGLAEVKGVTVNTVHGRAAAIRAVIRRINPDVETMEGAAFLYVCRQEKIPCAQIRAISNVVGIRDKRKWNILLAIRNLNEILIEILETI